MYFISPDVLSEAKGLSPGASGFFLSFGFFLWAFGWRWHRFWIVFAITMTAGILGLNSCTPASGQVMAVGVLLAASAGMLALDIARILSFLSGGTAAWAASSSLWPEAQELWVAFLCGGLMGVVLCRLWTMLATSLLGLMLCWHAVLNMLEQFTSLNAAELAYKYQLWFNGGLVICTLLGVMVQSYTGAYTGLNTDVADHKQKPLEEKKHQKKAEPSTSLVGRMLKALVTG